MNHKHILDLTLRLSQALDQNYDVVSMETVLSVISALEGATITKEQLEATRLAKYINQLRRRTKSDNLARRAKSLLKKWREMVGIQQTNETIGTVGTTVSGTSNSILPTAAPINITVTDNAVSTSHLTTPQYRDPQFLYQRPQHHNTKQQNQQQPHQPCHSQPTSPQSFMEKSNPNEFLNSTMSNPAPVSLLTKGGNLTVRKKKRLEKISYDKQPPQQPTSFANLLTGFASSNSLSVRKSRDKCDSGSTTKPMETFIIEHSSNSNSNSDLICMPSKAVSAFTSSKNVPPIVIDLQDSNSSMSSLVSKDANNASLPFSLTKPSTKKPKKEKKRKERDMRQNQPLHDCEDNNTTTNISYLQRVPDIAEEKSHSACPTISNISEILSLSNSSMSSVFPSTEAISKNVYTTGQSELTTLTKMKKSDLTFAGKFKQNTSATSALCDVLNYNSDMNINATSNLSASPNKSKFTPFSGIGIATNSSDSNSNSRDSQFNVVVDAIKDTSNISKQNIDAVQVKQDSNDKSMSNMSNKGNSSTDNVFATAPSATISQPQHQSIDLTTTDLSSEQIIKLPKKRGRKKGSKGVDSVIAKETSLSSQMLISSLSAGSKKVKTTKELYAEMQNRKLQSATAVGSGVDAIVSSAISWPLQHQQKTQISRHGSSCSDIAESDSCTMTSEPSRDSANPAKIGKGETPLDSNSNYSQFDSDLKLNEVTLTTKVPDSDVLTTEKIKNEMCKIFKQLPPPPTLKDIEQQYINDIIPCTCTIIEIIPKPERADITCDDQADKTDSIVCATFKDDANVEESKQFVIENVNASVLSSNNEQSDSFQMPPTKLKKSIFDVDFDDDEDPLNSIIADIVGKNDKETISETTATLVDDGKSDANIKLEEDPMRNNQEIVQLDCVTNPQPLDSFVFPTYEVKLDPDCRAKDRFETQTQKITKFHIDALHNCFIPNVNGNWNHADVVTSDNNILRKSDTKLDVSKIIDGYGVVPYYSSEISEHIVKDLSQVKFTNKFKPKRSAVKYEMFNNIPFMGRARILEFSIKSRKQKPQRRKHKNINCLNNNDVAQTEADLENTTIINNNNIILNKISIDVKSEIESSTLPYDNLSHLLAIAEDINHTNSEATEANNQETVCKTRPPESVFNANEIEEVDLKSLDVKKLGSRRNSSSSNDSLQPPETSIYTKSKHQRHENKRKFSELGLNENKSNLKRTKKTLKTKKRYRNSVNGNQETNKQINNARNNTADDTRFSDDGACSGDNSDSTESDCSDNDDIDNEFVEKGEEQNEYNCDYHHEVVTHDNIATSSGRNHIVLTIKKTSSKTNSPNNVLSSSLKMSNNVNSVKTDAEEKIAKNTKENQKQDQDLQMHINNQQLRKKEEEELSSSYKKIYCEKPMKISRLQVLNKKIKRKKVSSLTFSLRNKLKLHKLLFFPDEICHFERQGTQQCKEYIFNISSCSSSCSDEEQNEMVGSETGFFLTTENHDNLKKTNLTKTRRSSVSSSSSSSSSKSSVSSSFDLQGRKLDYENTLNEVENVTSLNNDEDHDVEDLPEDNNLMLLTFNNIYCNTERDSKNINCEQHKQQEKGYHENILKQQLQNCDDYNNLYNNSNFNFIKYIDNKSSFVKNIINSCSNNYSDQVYNNSMSSSSRDNCNSDTMQKNFENVNHKELQNVPYKEYRTGIRAVDEDVDDAHGNNCGRLQQFKEWHEVLQLRSYNDELLPVLPYVVLE